MIFRIAWNPWKPWQILQIYFLSTRINLKTLFSPVNKELSKAHQWFISNKLLLDTRKTKFLLLHKPSQTDNPPLILQTLKINDNVIERVQLLKILRVILDEGLPWNKHNHIYWKQGLQNIDLLYQATFLNKKSMECLYYS